MAFFLFLLVNATLFLRPAEIVPELLGWRIYEVLILGCCVASGPAVLEFFSRRQLSAQPITLCVFGLLAAILLSNLSHLNFEAAAATSFEFFKVLVYFVLLMALVTTPARLRQFLFWIGVFCTGLTLIAVLRYYDVITIQTPVPVSAKAEKKHESEFTSGAYVQDRQYDPNSGQMVVINRLRGTGVFQDPNDLCLVLVTGIPIGLYWLTERRLGLARLLWLGPVLLFLFALALTASRGGFLALLAGCFAFSYSRYGARKSLLLGLALLPLLLLAFGGRMTQVATGEGTGQQRIQIWSDGLDLFREAPLFGIGMDQYFERVQKVAHNSFLHCYAELGLLGGTLFLGAFYFALLGLHRLGMCKGAVFPPGLQRLRPYLMGLIVAYAVGMLSLSRSYIVPTYMVLGLAGAYFVMVQPYVPRPVLACQPQPDGSRRSILRYLWSPVSLPRLDLALVQRLAVVSAFFLAATYLFVRVFRA